MDNAKLLSQAACGKARCELRQEHTMELGSLDVAPLCVLEHADELTWHWDAEPNAGQVVCAFEAPYLQERTRSANCLFSSVASW